jgi:hypothetical protein
MMPEEITRNKKLQDRIQDAPKVPDKFDMQGMIGYLHKFSGRIPTENECLRFYMFLRSFEGNPTQKECEDFLRILGMVRE